MKNFKSMRRLLAAMFAVTLVSVAITSCYKDAPQAPGLAENPLAGKYVKQIVLNDHSGRNTATLEISTDDAGMLDWFTADDLLYSVKPDRRREAVDEEIPVENLDNATMANQTERPEHLVIINLKKTENSGEESEHVILFSNALQDKLNAVGATIRYITENEAVGDNEAAERGPISGSPKRIKLSKNTVSKPALFYVKWRCGNIYYTSVNYYWPANDGATKAFTVCPTCSASTRYFYYYDYYCSASYSIIYLSWQSTACN